MLAPRATGRYRENASGDSTAVACGFMHRILPGICIDFFPFPVETNTIAHRGASSTNLGVCRSTAHLLRPGRGCSMGSLQLRPAILVLSSLELNVDLLGRERSEPPDCVPALRAVRRAPRICAPARVHKATANVRIPYFRTGQADARARETHSQP